jgi:nitronate monooxygenase
MPPGQYKRILAYIKNISKLIITRLKSFKIGDLNINVPVIQGGMGVGISLAGLASAVANMGGVGVISAVGIGIVDDLSFKNYRQVNIDALRLEIQKARSMTTGILGVNIMVALTNFADMVSTSIEEGIDIIFSGAGLPLDLPKYLKKGSKTKLVPIVSSARAASVICKKWMHNYNYLPDAIVVEGPKAGGHLGFKSEEITEESHQLEVLIPEVVKEKQVFEEQYGKSIPVIAAGGIYTGEDIAKIMNLGANAVQLGTRFVATHECDAADSFKDAYLSATQKNTVIIKSPVGMPGRAIKNSFLTEAEEGKKKPSGCKFHCLITCNFKETSYCILDALTSARKGDLDKGFAFAGSNVHRIDKLTSVEEVFKDLEESYEAYNLKNPKN